MLLYPLHKKDFLHLRQKTAVTSNDTEHED